MNAETAPHQDPALSDSARGDAAAVSRSRTPADPIEDAEVEATLAEHRRWVAACRPGAVSHADAMAELLRDGQ